MYEPVGRRVGQRATCPIAFDEATEFSAIRMTVDSLRRERLQQQLSPAVEKLRAGVHLDREHVAGGEMVARRQPLADLPRASAHFVATVSEPGQHLAAHHARIR